MKWLLAVLPVCLLGLLGSACCFAGQPSNTGAYDEPADWGIWVSGTTHRSVIRKNGEETGPTRRPENASTSAAPQETPQELYALDQKPYSERDEEDVTKVSGTIHGSVVWKRSKSPYLMAESVFVAEDGTLTIEPGVVVKVFRPAGVRYSGAKDGVSLNVYGKIIARGTPEAMIRFTPASANPEKYGEWGGVSLYGSKPSTITWSVIEYAGFGADCYVNALISHCVFRYCHSGIYLERGFIGDVLHNVSAYNSYSGIRCNGTRAEATILNNICYMNGDGIDSWNDAVAYADHNLIWSRPLGNGRRQDYSKGAIPGKNDLIANPGFASEAELDFRLAPDSPARGAGFDGADIGLYPEGWSAAAAQKEIDEWLAGGARELWCEGIFAESRRGPANARVLYEQALEKCTDDDLRVKILCSLGRVLLAENYHDQAVAKLQHAVKAATQPHLRDLARRSLAEAIAQSGRHQDALRMVREAEWTQSKVWVEPAIAKYTALTGDVRSALSSLETVKPQDPTRYVSSVREMIAAAISAEKLDAAVELLNAYGAYPLCEQASFSRLEVANALRSRNRAEQAASVLKESIEADPFHHTATEALDHLAEILESDLGRPDEAKAVRVRLVTHYYTGDRFVQEALAKLGEDAPSLPRNKVVLLDESLGESSIFDRWTLGSCNFGQWDVIRALTEQGYIVHSNGGLGRQELTPDAMARYGLIVMNGRYGGDSDPPIPGKLIDELVDYVRLGGSLMVVSAGPKLGRGREARFYNPLVSRFGIHFVDDRPLADQSQAGRTADDPAVAGLTGFRIGGGTAAKADDGRVLAYCGQEPVIVSKDYGSGRVVGAGLGSGVRGKLFSTRGSSDGGVVEMNKALLVKLVEHCLSSAPNTQVLIRPIATSPGSRKTQRPRGGNRAEITWEPMGAIEGGCIYSLVVSRNGDIFAGGTSGVFRSTDNGKSWQELTGGAGISSVMCLAINDQDDVFCGTMQGKIYKSSDRGESWSLISGAVKTGEIYELAVNSRGHIFAGTSRGVLRSMDNGDSWEEAAKGLNAAVHSLMFYGNGCMLAGSSEGRLFRSADNGNTWSRLEVNVPQNSRWIGRVFDLAPGVGLELYAAVESSGVFRSRDNGKAWERCEGVETRIPYHIHLGTDGRIYAGGAGGVFFSTDQGDTWRRVYEGLTNPDVSCTTISRDGYVLAGTLGGGVCRTREAIAR